jgi:hypothetical protein
MRKSILSSVLALLLVLIIVLSGVAIAKWSSAYQNLKIEAKNLRAERDVLRAKLEAAEQLATHLVAESTSESREVPVALTPTPADAAASTNTLNLWAVRPDISTNTAGKKTYYFGELYGANNQVIARDAHFEELLGFTKLAFRTSKGTRYYDLDDVHPEVVRSLGYDATVLKRRLAEDARHRQMLGAQAQFQAELRAKAAAELVDREKAAAERLKAEAAIRDAEARERLAEAAERAATNPPKPQRVTQKVIINTYNSRLITNTAPPAPNPNL